MGLPLFYGCDEDSSTRVTEKIDRLAASNRSVIRRERTIREPDARRRSAERLVNRPSGGLRTEVLPEIRSRHRVRVRREDGAEYVFRPSTFREPRSSAGAEDTSFDENLGGERRQSRQAGEELLHHALQHQRAGQRMRVPRSSRTSALRFELASTSHSSASPEASPEEQTLLARPYMPSPPYSFSDNSTTDRPARRRHGSLEIAHAEPTPGFAPARGARLEQEEHGTAAIQGGAARQHPALEEDESWTASYPPLRRVGHLSPRPQSRLSAFDGLEDRRRIYSPSSSSSSEVEHDSWDTLLTTMEPDNHLPSADSSFTSATASQSTLQSRRSSQTPTTSFGSTGASTDRRPSRPPSPRFPDLDSNQLMEMDLEIHSDQYDCLSQESRASMRSMIFVIQSLRRFRNRPEGDEASSEHRQRLDENLILCHHFWTLRMMDQVRSSRESSRQSLGYINNNSNNNNIGRITGLNRPSSAPTDRPATNHQHSQQTMRHLESYRRHVDFHLHPPSPVTEEGTRLTSDSAYTSAAAAQNPSPQHHHHQEQQQHRDHNPPWNRDAPPVPVATTDAADTDSDLISMQRFIERMARRQDIPDQWWASIGLARTIREN